MKILELFGKYFLALILIQGTILIFIDAKSFKKEKLEGLCNKARSIGFGWIMVAVILFAVRMFIY